MKNWLRKVFAISVLFGCGDFISPLSIRPPVNIDLSGVDSRFFIAGGICAAASHGITTPIDVVKTKIQAQPEVYNKGLLKAAMCMVKTDGPSVLLQGLAPTVVGYGIEGAMKFGVYEVSKSILASVFNGITTSVYMIAAVLAGAIASILLCPMEDIRIHMVTDSKYKDLNIFTGFARVIRKEGILGSFGGIGAMLTKQIPYTIAKQVFFDCATKSFYALVATNSIKILPKDKLKLAISVSSAFLASIAACIFSQPGDMILTETFKDSKRDRNIFSVIKSIYKRDGLRGYFLGTEARIFHVAAIITSQLVVYDIVKQLLGLPATGKH